MQFVQKMRELWSIGKTSTSSFVLERALKSHLSTYGDMINISIDSLQKKALVEILLKGEQEPITLSVGEYQVVDEEGKNYLIVKRATCSREWMNIFIGSFLVEKKIPIPEKYGRILKLMI